MCLNQPVCRHTSVYRCVCDVRELYEWVRACVLFVRTMYELMRVRVSLRE